MYTKETEQKLKEYSLKHQATTVNQNIGRKEHIEKTNRASHLAGVKSVALAHHQRRHEGAKGTSLGDYKKHTSLMSKDK